MSTNIGDQTMLACGKVTTPTTGDVQWRWANSAYDFLFTAIVVTVSTAGAQAGSLLRLADAAGTVIGEATMGTSAQYVTVTTLIADASSYRALGTGNTSKYVLTHVTTDASAVYYWAVFGTLLHN